MKKCMECEHCKMMGRADARYAGSGYWYGRGLFFCKNPKTIMLPNEAFGRKMRGFIGFGTPEKESRLQIKTSPRWCPMRRERSNENDRNHRTGGHRVPGYWCRGDGRGGA